MLSKLFSQHALMITKYVCNYQFYHKLVLVTYLVTYWTYLLPGVNSTSCL